MNPDLDPWGLFRFFFFFTRAAVALLQFQAFEFINLLITLVHSQKKSDRWSTSYLK